MNKHKSASGSSNKKGKKANAKNEPRASVGSFGFGPGYMPPQSIARSSAVLINDADVFLNKLRHFKPQSLGCLEARRKSSSTLIFPSPPQACLGASKCTGYPHYVKPTAGYWIECHGPDRNQLDASKPAPASISAFVSTQQQSAKTVVDSLSSPIKSAIKPTSVNVVANSSSPISTTDDSLGQAQVTQVNSTSPQAVGFVKPVLGVVRGDSYESSRAVQQPDSLSRASSSNETPSPAQSFALVPAVLSKQKHHKILVDRQMSSDSMKGVKRRSFDESSALAGLLAHQVSSSSSAEPQKQSTRGKTNKRKMTRDDMDLNRGPSSRRGTPNITVTEASITAKTQVLLGAFNSAKSEVKLSASSSTTTNNSMSQPTSHTSLTPEADVSNEFCSVDQRDVKEGWTTSDRSMSQRPSVILEDESIFVDGKPSTKQLKLDAHRRRRRRRRLATIKRSPTTDEASDNESDDFELNDASDETDDDHDDDDNDDDENLNKDDYNNISNDDDDDDDNNDYDNENENYNDNDDELNTSVDELEAATKGLQMSNELAYSDTSSCGGNNYQDNADNNLELIKFEEENYEKHYYGREHWNYFTNDESLGPVMLSLKQEAREGRDYIHVLLRTVSYTLHGTLPASAICADRYDREAIVRELSDIARLKPPLVLGQLSSTPEELLKLDHMFIKSELKVGVIFVKQGQENSEEAILSNKNASPLFEEFLNILGTRVQLRGHDRYKGGLDNVHNLTGLESVYTYWRNIEIMFHVSTMLPHEEGDPQKLQKKRHIGNDIVCVAFIEAPDDANLLFWPGCIKSFFLHTFIAVQTTPRAMRPGERRKYRVSCVCRNEVQHAFKPFLVYQDTFYNNPTFREWLLVKIVNGERASYSAPKFARMQDRTRSQMLEEITTNLANHLLTGQIPKPYRRGSWRPLGHVRASSPLDDSMKDYFEDYETLARDFYSAFCGPSKSVLCDVVFKVKSKLGDERLVYGVRAILGIRSRVFLDMLFGAPPAAAAASVATASTSGSGSHPTQNPNTTLRGSELKALGAGESSLSAAVAKSKSSSDAKIVEPNKSSFAKRGSVGHDMSRKTNEKERRQSMLPNLSKSLASRPPTYLTVPSQTTSAASGSSVGTGGLIKSAFNRLVFGNWSGWSGNIKGYKNDSMHINVDQNNTKIDLNSIALCKEISKIDTEKLSQREFEIKEFDYETFKPVIEYVHNGQCLLSYETIPGIICAAEHYDLADLMHACFHHANQNMKLSAMPTMLNPLYQSSCFYVAAMQLINVLFEYIDSRGDRFLSGPNHTYLLLEESVFTALLSRKSLQVSEIKKFQAMCEWSKYQVVASSGSQQVTSSMVDKNEYQTTSSHHQQQPVHQQQSLPVSSNLKLKGGPQQSRLRGYSQKRRTSANAADQVSSSLAANEHQQNQSIITQDVVGFVSPVNRELHDEETRDFKALMLRINKEISIKLDQINTEDLVKIVLPTKVFENKRIFDVIANDERCELY